MTLTTSSYLTLFPSFKRTNLPLLHMLIFAPCILLILPRPAPWLIDSVRADRTTLGAADRQRCKIQGPRQPSCLPFSSLLFFSLLICTPWSSIWTGLWCSSFQGRNLPSTTSPPIWRTLWCLRLKGEGTPANTRSTTSGGYVRFLFRRPRRFVSSWHFASRLLRPTSGWTVCTYHSTSEAHPEGSSVAGHPTQVLMQCRANAPCTGYLLDAWIRFKSLVLPTVLQMAQGHCNNRLAIPLLWVVPRCCRTNPDVGLWFSLT